MNAIEQTLALPDGRAICYAEWGDPAGIPVLYCHGFPGSRLEARLADAAARALGIRLIAPDRPGFGRSDFLAGREIRDWPADLAAIADALALERFQLLGVSGGAPYALAAARDLGERVPGVALVCGLGEFVGEHATAGMNPAAAHAIDFQRRWPRLGHSTYRHVVGPLLRRFPQRVFDILVGNGTPADREVLSDPVVRDAIVASFREAFHQGSRGPAREVGLITRPWGIDPADVRQPAQLWHGEADRTVPVAMGRRHATLLPDVKARFIAGEGHFSLIVRYMDEILAGLIGTGRH